VTDGACVNNLSRVALDSASAWICTRDLLIQHPNHLATYDPQRGNKTIKRKQATCITSCARGDSICLRPLQVDNIFAFIRQVAPVPACWLFKTSATRWPLTLKVVSVPILVFLCLSVLELNPMYTTDRRQTDVRRHTDVRQKHRLMPPPYGGGGIKRCFSKIWFQ